jgi:pseudaminic acid synthase
MSSSFDIAGRTVGTGHPTYIVAEVSANHGGSLERTIELVHAIADAGADAVKLQTYTADTLTIDSDAPPFRVSMRGAWEGRVLHDLYDEAHTPWEWHAPIKAAADDRGVALFSSAFDTTAIELLEDLGVPAYKVASFEVVDLDLVRAMARTGKPIIVSTGMANYDEVVEAVEAVRDEGGGDRVALLKCTSAYPADPAEMHLRTIPDMAERFGVPIGLSDHTMGTAVPVAAVALGACIVEKHVTLARADGGPDSHFSLEPPELEALVRDIRTVDAALGSVSYEPTPEELRSREYRRSLFVVEDVADGEPFTERNVRSIRPGHGLPPKRLPEVIGRRAARSVTRGTPVTEDLLS